MAYWRVTLFRSAIGLPKTYMRTLEALGLTKRMRTVYLDINPKNAGQLFKVKELVKVETTPNALSRQEERNLRRPDKGYVVETIGK